MLIAKVLMMMKKGLNNLFKFILNNSADVKKMVSQ